VPRALLLQRRCAVPAALAKPLGCGVTPYPAIMSGTAHHRSVPKRYHARWQALAIATALVLASAAAGGWAFSRATGVEDLDAFQEWAEQQVDSLQLANTAGALSAQIEINTPRVEGSQAANLARGISAHLGGRTGASVQGGVQNTTRDRPNEKEMADKK